MRMNFRAIAPAIWCALTATGVNAAELIMVEQRGCHWCAQWNADIGPIYPKTNEGRFAPLRRIDLHQKTPDDLELDGRAVFTPTFILVEDGQELARMEGYGGEELFWWGLSNLLNEHTDFREEMTQ